jgi:hypothetical protein
VNPHQGQPESSGQDQKWENRDDAAKDVILDRKIDGGEIDPEESILG